MNKPLNTTAAATAALWLAAVTCAQAQNWNGSKLNSIAVTNETGAIIVSGTDGSFNNSANATKAAVFDGNTATFFDPDGTVTRAQACWAGFELQAQKMVTRVRYYGRTGNAHRMRGCLFQGANLPDFSDALTLHVNVIRVSEKREKARTGWNSAAYAGFRLYGYMRTRRR